MTAPPAPKPELPLDPDLVRFVEALAVARAHRDHERAIVAGRRAAASAQAEKAERAKPG